MTDQLSLVYSTYLPTVNLAGYCLAVKQDDWQGHLTRTIAGEVRRHRLARKLSAQKLADRCGEFGFPVPRSVIANLENGYRESVSVAELLVLAAALDVAPVLLVAPLGHEPVTQILPGRTLRTWDAVLWQSGEVRLPEDASAHEAEWLDWREDDQAIVPLYRQHEFELYDVENSSHEGILVPGPDGRPNLAESVKIARELRQHAVRALRVVRNRMRELGLTPPELPRELAHIDRKDRRRGAR